MLTDKESIVSINFISKLLQMARIAGVNLPHNKRIIVALTYIYGIGHISAQRICEMSKIDYSIRASKLSEEQINVLRQTIRENFVVEGDLRTKVSLNIKSLIDLGCYRGLRHRKRLPVHGQRTHTNARTRKGKAIPIAGKKKS